MKEFRKDILTPFDCRIVEIELCGIGKGFSEFPDLFYQLGKFRSTTLGNQTVAALFSHEVAATFQLTWARLPS